MGAAPDGTLLPRMLPDGEGVPGRSSRFRRLLRPPVAAFALALVLTGAVAVWATHPPPPTLELELTFSDDACCSFQVWVNETTLEHITVLPIQAGRRVTYSVPLSSPAVDHLWMPLGDVASSSVTIHSIRIAQESRTTDEVGASELARITPYQARIATTDEGPRVIAEGRQPFADLPVSLTSTDSALRLRLAKHVWQPTPDIAGLLLVGVFLLATVGVATRVQLGVLVAVALTLVVVRVLPRLSWQLRFKDDVSEAVGFSSYTGTWKVRERLILMLAALAAVAIGVLAAAVTRRWLRPAPDTAAEETRANRPLRRRLSVPLVVLPILVIGLAAVPDLQAMIGSGRTVEYIPSWDGNNLLFWHYLVQTTDLVPMKDFFWPYGWQWLFDEALPWGTTWSFVAYLWLWALLVVGIFLSLSRFFEGRALVIRFALLSGFCVVCSLSGYVPFTTRYIAPLAAVLLFAGIDGRDGWRSWRRLLFAVALFGITLFELAQAVYALVPIGFLALVELATQVQRTREGVARWVAVTGLTIALPLLAACAVLASTGELTGTLRYYAELDALLATFSWPAPVAAWVEDPTTLASFIFWAVPVSLAVGAYGLLARREQARMASAVVVALGLLGFMIMQKQVMRPPIEAQIWFPVIFAVPFWLAVDRSMHRVRGASIGLAVAGAILALTIVSGSLRKGLHDAAGGPRRLVHSVDALALERQKFAADARAQFAPERFANFTEYQDVVRALKSDPAVRSGGRVWILGDDTPITMMLGQSWPWYFHTFYDISPIAFQRRVIRELERTPPSRVAWNFSKQAMIFDAVPNVVRAPLAFQWAVTNLAPLTTVEHFAILRPLRPGEPVHLEWWRRRIGSTIDLGHVPELARLGEQPCSSGPSCGTFVMVDVAPGASRPSEVLVPVTVAGLRFDVKLKTSPSASRYVVPLDRLWFWAAARSGPSAVGTSGTSGVRITVVRRQRDGGRLY